MSDVSGVCAFDVVSISTEPSTRLTSHAQPDPNTAIAAADILSRKPSIDPNFNSSDLSSLPAGLPPRPIFYRPTGCQACAETGYTGRIGIFELLVIDEPVRREILNNSDAKKIARVAASRGMVSLREDGVRQVCAGRTSMDEVLAATHDSDVELE